MIIKYFSGGKEVGLTDALRKKLLEKRGVEEFLRRGGRERKG